MERSTHITNTHITAKKNTNPCSELRQTNLIRHAVIIQDTSLGPGHTPHDLSRRLGIEQFVLQRVYHLVTNSYSLMNILPVNGQEFPSLINVTIDDLSSGFEAGLFTSVDLVEAYLARIKEVNDEFKAVTEINPDALSIAAELDSKRANGVVLGPLHGIPILIKDNIATKDGMNNTAGSWALVGAQVSQDSFVARKLREGGAVILGKANMSQWAMGRSSNSSNGWSAYGGLGTGAYYPGMDPYGSSSGSGVATALGLSLAALGTEVSFSRDHHPTFPGPCSYGRVQ